LIPAALAPDIGRELSSQDVDEAARLLRRRAAQERWNDAALGAALVGVVAASNAWDQDERGLELLQTLTESQSWLWEEYPDAFEALWAVLSLGAGVNAFNSSDWSAALAGYNSATLFMLKIGMPTMALDCLSRLADAVREAGAPFVSEADECLAVVSPLAEAEIVGKTTRIVLHICGDLFTFLASPEVPVEASTLLSLLVSQIAKGNMFARVVREFVHPWHWSEHSDYLLERIRANELQLSGDAGAIETAPGPMLDEAMLLVSYAADATAQAGSTPQERINNLRGAFDERLMRDLSTRPASGGRTSFKPSESYVLTPEVREALGDRTVLVDVYVGRDGEGQLATHLLAVSPEEDRRVVISVPGLPAGDLVIGTGEDASFFSEVALSTRRLRQDLLRNPGPSLVSSDAQWALEDEVEGRLSPPLMEFLDKARARGRDHLCIVPHGPLHFYPYHLLGAPGDPLAGRWIVTYLPALGLLRSTPRTGRASVAISAIGCGFTGPNQHHLPPIPSSVEEAARVAGEYGLKSLPDEEATPGSVLSLLEHAKRAHIATHGRHNVAAPAFQHLYLNPGRRDDGRLFAYQILTRDLSGLELVTLSACETALGRFDRADNLRGLPASLLVAGVRTIIGTSWPVQTEASGSFFTTLHHHLAAGESSLDAFGKAQALTRKEFPAYRDWGPFQFVGTWV